MQGIEQIFNSMLSFFFVIYQGGQSVFFWMTSPISSTGDPVLDVVLESFYGYTPLELSFGAFLSTIIFLWFFKFLKGLI